MPVDKGRINNRTTRVDKEQSLRSSKNAKDVHGSRTSDVKKSSTRSTIKKTEESKPSSRSTDPSRRKSDIEKRSSTRSTSKDTEESKPSSRSSDPSKPSSRSSDPSKPPSRSSDPSKPSSRSSDPSKPSSRSSNPSKPLRSTATKPAISSRTSRDPVKTSSSSSKPTTRDVGKASTGRDERKTTNRPLKSTQDSKNDKLTAREAAVKRQGNEANRSNRSESQKASTNSRKPDRDARRQRDNDNLDRKSGVPERQTQKTSSRTLQGKSRSSRVIPTAAAAPAPIITPRRGKSDSNKPSSQSKSSNKEDVNQDSIRRERNEKEKNIQDKDDKLTRRSKEERASRINDEDEMHNGSKEERASRINDEDEMHNGSRPSATFDEDAEMSSVGSKNEQVDQTSLETMESGISVTTPRSLSSELGEVEESISSRVVEMDDTDTHMGSISSRVVEMDDTDTHMVGYADSLTSPPESLPISNALQPASYNSNSYQQDDDEDDEDNDYEEDFEDYDSDFEEDDTGSDPIEEDSLSSSSSSSSSPATLSSAEQSSESESSSAAASDSENEVQLPSGEMAAVLAALKLENSQEPRLERVYSVHEEPKNHVADDSSASKSVTNSEMAEPTIQQQQQQKQITVPRPKTSRAFVNFAGARQKQVSEKIASRQSQRGKVLLSMIQLDTITIDLLTLVPISYDAYITTFGNSNTTQVSVQTNEDALSEEIQTDEIVLLDKWTQNPVHISFKDDRLPGPEDYKGVGGDVDPQSSVNTHYNSPSSSTQRLTAFLNASSQVMLALLEEKLIWEYNASNETSSTEAVSEGLGFSNPAVPLGNAVEPLLNGRDCQVLQFCASQPTMLLSAHGYSSNEDDTNSLGLEENGLICVWSVQEPSLPKQLLICRSEPISATFSPGRASLVVGGLSDGSLVCWDLREPLPRHTHTAVTINDTTWRLRPPSFVTACGEGEDTDGGPIVAVETDNSHNDKDTDHQGAFQVVTLSSMGCVTWWVVAQAPLTSVTNLKKLPPPNKSSEVSAHLGASPWARITVTRSATINVGLTLYNDELLSCSDIKIDHVDPSQLYVATGSGSVAHCSRHTHRIHPKAYTPEIEPGCEAVCLCVCPHDQRYFLVGTSDGVVRLHNCHSGTPLTSWQSSPDAIKDLQWCPARPCVFYVLDTTGRFHIWDLSAGDIFPVVTVEAGGLSPGPLTRFHISSEDESSNQPLHAVFAGEGGSLTLRQVGKEYSKQQKEDYLTELERFTYYVNII